MTTQLELPSLLAYPKILDLDEIPELIDHLIYVIQYYKEDGISIIIRLAEDSVIILPGDFDGNPIRLDAESPNQRYIMEFVHKYSQKFVTLMKYIGITQALYYISCNNDDMRLVDIRLGLDKFTGPGMINDLFKTIIPLQELIKVIHMDNEVLQDIRAGRGEFSSNLILKTSQFKTVVRDNTLIPAYAKIVRSR